MGIIGQEIKMYDDDSNWRLYFGIIENMYPKNSLSIDIAGTVDSINKITAKLYLLDQKILQLAWSAQDLGIP